MEEIIDINEMLTRIMDNEIFVSKCPKETYFKLHKDKLLVVSENFRYIITFDEAKTIFQKQKFIPLDNSKFEEIDEEKDKEYYSWTHK